jgi:hypothetical protein
MDLKFPISVKEDLKKFKLAEISKFQNTAESVLSMMGVQENLSAKKEAALNPLLVIEVNDLSGALTSVVFNPNRDIVEDRTRPYKFNTKFFSMIVAKVQLALYTLQNLEKVEQLVFFYHYPIFSNFCLLILVFFFLTFDPSLLLSYIFAVFILILTCLNE